MKEILEMFFKIFWEKKELMWIFSFFISFFGKESGIIFVGIFFGYEFVFFLLVLL